MFKVLINYNFTPDPTWIGDDYLIYDRSDDGIDHLIDFDQSKIIRTTNVGQVDYDKLRYLVDNYDTLPDVFLWGKTNLFKYVAKEEYDLVKDNKDYTPILSKSHEERSDNVGAISYYAQDIYWERNDSWFFGCFSFRYVSTFPQWASIFMIDNPPYIPFAPGGNYILTRERVHRYSRDFYAKMAETLPYCTEPAEAQCCERSYHLLWR